MAIVETSAKKSFLVLSVPAPAALSAQFQSEVSFLHPAITMLGSL